MKAFISYSHQDGQMLDLLHKHLVQLQRDNVITTWTDNQISAGGEFNKSISSELNRSNLFIALLSPDYLASNYCYEMEFKKALEMQAQDKIIIIPIILEPCDWLNTPFNKFKALPKDGKAISTYENKNNAFLDVAQNIRKLVTAPIEAKAIISELKPSAVPISRNYRVQKDFDSIEKIEFIEKTFHEVKEYLKRYIEEILQIDNIKSRTLLESTKVFECILVNRNKIATESNLKISISTDESKGSPFFQLQKDFTYSITNKNRPTDKGFTLAFDEYHLFWKEDAYSNSQAKKELESKDIADVIWNEWLESVGIL